MTNHALPAGDDPVPTHQCKECGALWRFWRTAETGAENDSWNLRSATCGKCCGLAPMGDQLVPLTFSALKAWLGTRLEAVTGRHPDTVH